MNEHDQDMVELLRRDAERIREGEAFDVRLHQDTMRAIRQLEPPARSTGWWSPARMTMTVTAMAACVILVLVLQPDSGPPSPVPGMVATGAPSTALTYRSALSEGEDALMAMLDEDARVLLPRSSGIFQTDY